jgi:superfamily I DNA/RNA helicase
MNQGKFIECCEPRIRCLAGPGTGKTWSIKQRVKRLLTQDKVAGSRVFAVTFTKLAASQLKAELTEMEVEGSNAIVASTLHSHALRILGHEQAIESLGRVPRICYEYEMKPFFADLSMAFGGRVKPVQTIFKEFETMWALNQYEVIRTASEPEEIIFEDEYQSWMRFHKAMTVGELIPLAVTFLTQNPVNDAVSEFDHIIVDEYQDLNWADQALIELIGKDSKIAIVGDDDQSIYSFRYADPAGIRTWLSRQEVQKEDIQLNICRRCDGNIISLANSLIRSNSGRGEKNDLVPLADRADAGDVDFVKWNTRERETKGIALGIKKLLDKDMVPDGEKILVLVPRRDFGQYLVEELEDLNVVDVNLHTKPDWSNETLGESLSLLVLHEAPDDLVALRYCLGLGHDKWRKSEYKKLLQYCQDHNLEPQEVLSNFELCNEIRVKGLRKRWEELQSKLEEMSALNEDDLLDLLLPLDGPTKKMSEKVRFLKQSDEENRSLTDLLTEAIVSVEEENDEAQVNIMTIHGAKGLTSHTVILTSLINGLLPRNPNPRNLDDKSKLEEEKRLLYVGLTRAKHRLVLSSFRKIKSSESQRLNLGLSSRGRYCTTISSQFISEFGSELPSVLDGDRWLSLLD